MVAFTGAGISTPSGIPDFRSPAEGLWLKHDPMEVASLTVFRRSPKKFFNWLNPILAGINAAQPNPAHFALARLEQAGILKSVVTQNIDTLHTRAGSRNVLEVHGSLATSTCPKCKATYPSEEYIPVVLAGKLPHCPACGAVVKPDIVLYEEMLPIEAWRAAQKAALSCDLMLVVGSSLETMPAAGLCMAAHHHGAKIIINTLSPTTFDPIADVLIREDTLRALPALADAVLAGKGPGSR
jgi:NAD-dependent deacetylase